MATNFLKLATTLKYLGAKWLPGKKVNFTPCYKCHLALTGVKGLNSVQSTLAPCGLHKDKLLQCIQISFDIINIARSTKEILLLQLKSGKINEATIVCVHLGLACPWL